ncbi:xanthotoxin 5-hydroxylase CYP82C4-like isoform X2 [Punica granatum]|uniref:Xanthotoxin 5-hydroxylase CYP82C4-like isoform X2 n=1 Tax=Punica granatum TaxID=22663 RepID=A0A6P8ELV0_PUNGR|nr:xanthotoxin 5-hydroxylase CYP82C4-like isoform X2 [Punica granatum]
MEKSTLSHSMEDPLLSQLLALASLIALFLVLWTAKRSRCRSQSTENARFNLPPEIPDAWPIIGHLHLLRKPVPLARILASMSDHCGPIFLIRLGVHQAVVISTNEYVRECFTTHDRTLASRPRSRVGLHLGYNFAALAFAQYGPYWRQMRKLMMLELLSHSRLKALKNLQVSEINTLIKGLYDTMIARKRYFGSRAGGLSVERDAAHAKRVIKEFVRMSGFPAISDLIPYTGWTDFVGPVRSMKRIAKEFDSIVGSWVEEHEQRRSVINGERNSQRKKDLDFIDVMISVIEDNSMLGFSKETIIKATVVILIVAGSGTTSLTLTWILSLLLNHKHVLDKAHEELDLKIGRDRWVRDSDIESLPYLQAIVKETLRLYPPAPHLIPHEGDEDCIVNGYLVPKGSRLFVNVWKLHRDPRVWSDPDDFLPERFLANGDAADMDVSGQHFEFIPFGSGRRACPGAALAIQVTHLALARLLQGFDIATLGDSPVDMTEGRGASLSKVNPVEVLLMPRLPTELFEELTESS